MGWKNEGPSDAQLLSAPEPQGFGGDMNATVELDGDEYEVAVGLRAEAA